MASTSVTVHELEELLRKSARSSFISFTAITTPDMRTRQNPYCEKDGRRWIPHVRKVAILSGALINCSYSRVVSQRRLKESQQQRRAGKWVPHPRAWGKHETSGPLICHEVSGESRLYLHVQVQHRRDHFFDDRDGKRIDEATIAEWLNERDSGYSQQQLRASVIVKDFQLSSVAEITLNRNRYTIAPAASELQTYLPATVQPAASAAGPGRDFNGQTATKGAT